MFDNCIVLLLNKLSLSLLQNIVHFGSPIDSNSQDLTKFTHHALHNTYHILHMIMRLDKILRLIIIVLFKTKPSAVYRIFFDENQDLNNTDN